MLIEIVVGSQLICFFRGKTRAKGAQHLQGKGGECFNPDESAMVVVLLIEPNEGAHSTPEC